MSGDVMRSCRRLVTTGILGTVMLTSQLTAQDTAAAGRQRGNVLQTPRGPVEFLGLERWTVAGLDDSLRKYAHYSLTEQGAHACGAVLRYKLHFPDAASILLSPTDGGKPTWLVTLTEPADSARIHHRDLPEGTTGGRPEWAAMRAVSRAHRGTLGTALQIGAWNDTAAWAALPAELRDSSARAAYRAFYEAHTSERDEQAAIAVLQRDSNWYDREIAVGLLFFNFPGDNRSWDALSQTMLESDGDVRFDAVYAMASLAAVGHRPQTWSGVSEAFHAVLDGTSQFVMPDAMALLNVLKPDSALAKPLLQGGGHMLLAYAGSGYTPFRDEALTLLRELSGKDFGADVGQWRSWVASL
jgi:hypothetical protein